MIHFSVDTAGFDNMLKCGTINFFDGWVASTDPHNPVKSVRFSVDNVQIGQIPVKRERPDLARAFNNPYLGFYGTCDIPESAVNKTLELYAISEDGSTYLMRSYPLKNILSQEEKDFRANNLLPSDLLRHLVVHSINPQAFLEEGKAGVEIIKSILAENNLDLLSMKNILDFGAGCGRVFRWWQEYSSAINFWACDVNADVIAWCRENLAFGSFTVNNLLPPTVYTDAQFDLIYLFSVFTHLASETQVKWLDEFARISRPGGVLMVSVHGDYHANFLPKDCLKTYKKQGYYVMSKNAEGENICTSYQNRKYSEHLFSKQFKVLKYYAGVFKTCGNQDLYLLKKK